MIYPETFPEHRVNHSERAVFESLAKLGPEFDVFYNQTFARRHAKEPLLYEVDFLVFDLQGGKLNRVFVIEVKGGLISYSSKRKKWYSNGHELSKGPDEQAAGYVRNLILRYEKFGANAVPFVWLLWFPDGVKNSGAYLPSQLEKWCVLTQSELYAPSDALNSVTSLLPERFRSFGGFALEKYREIIQKDLLQDLEITPNLKGLLAEINLTYDQLAANQKLFFTGMTDLPRLAINGGAGSGKSILAKFAAAYFTAEGKNVLLLCYNKQLKLELEKGLPKLTLTDHILSFMHAMIGQFSETSELESREDMEDYYLNELPANFSEIVHSRAWQVHELFDAIIVDEGQDMKGEWLEMLTKLLKPEGRYFIFYDEMQNIFNRDFSLPAGEDWTKINLRYNYRNSRLISSFINSHLDLSLIPGIVPEGKKVQIASYSSDESLQQGLGRLLFQLIRTEGISASSLKIILDGSLRKWDLSHWKLDFGFEFDLLDADKEEKEHVVYLTSINRFKGCESDIVILVLNTPLASIPDKKMRYTQLSRAKGLLVIFEKEGA